jgi:aquaporin Z
VTDHKRPRWPEYLIEGLCLGLFMVSAAVFATLLQHPRSPFAGWIAQDVSRRLVMGPAMGATAIGLIYSPFGMRSGAHMNPSVTLAFLRLGRISPAEAAGYIAGQFVGGTAGILLATAMLAGLPADPSVNYVATLPGPAGAVVAFVAEATIAFGMMTIVLRMSSLGRLERFTGLAAGLFVAVCIVLEGPLSGMSMNPARTLGSNLLSHSVDTLWIYFTAPPLGMLLAAELFARETRQRSCCPKLFHSSAMPCIFGCQAASASRENA